MCNAGALLFSKRVTDFFLQSPVVCVIFKGTEKVTVLVKVTFDGDIVTNYKRALSYLPYHLNTEYVIKGGPREEILELPEDAPPHIREAGDYGTRVEREIGTF